MAEQSLGHLTQGWLLTLKQILGSEGGLCQGWFVLHFLQELFETPVGWASILTGWGESFVYKGAEAKLVSRSLYSTAPTS